MIAVLLGSYIDEILAGKCENVAEYKAGKAKAVIL